MMKQSFFFILTLLAFRLTAAETSIKLIDDQLSIQKAQLELNDLINPLSDEFSEDKSSFGAFKVALKIKHPRLGAVILEETKIPVFISPGANLELLFTETGSVEFLGDLSSENEFLSEFYSMYGQLLDSDSTKSRILNSTNVDVFEMDIYEERANQMTFLRSSKAALSDQFTEMLGAMINYNYYAQLFSYPVLRASAAESETVKALPDVMTESVAKGKLSNSSALNTLSYQQFIRSYLKYKTAEAFKFQRLTNPSQSIMLEMETARNELTDKVLSFAIASILSDHHQGANRSSIKSGYNALKQLDKSEHYFPVLEEDLLASMDRVEEKQPKAKKEKSAKSGAASISSKSGKGKSGIKLQDTNGKMVSLSSFKGKVVYIDFWASWCGPCRREFPHAKQMKNKLSKKELKEIVFLYISIDNTEAGWKRAIDNFKIEGTHLFSPGGWNSEATKAFQINSIPRYMIMDRHGDIKHHNAPRPSDPRTLDLLLDLL